MQPDATQVKARIERKIEEMIKEYERYDSYLDLDGKRHKDSTGIILAWNELDAIK